MELDEIDPLDTEIRARALVPREERLAVVVLGQLLDPPAHLGRDEHLGMAPVQLAAELLAAPVAVHVGGVEEGDPGLDGGLEHRVCRLGSTSPQSAPSCQVPRPMTLTLRPSRSIFAAPSGACMVRRQAARPGAGACA